MTNRSIIKQLFDGEAPKWKIISAQGMKRARGRKDDDAVMIRGLSREIQSLGNSLLFLDQLYWLSHSFLGGKEMRKFNAALVKVVPYRHVRAGLRRTKGAKP